MKDFDTIAAQGDLILKRISELPSGIEPAKTEKGNYVLAHSETGHCHVIEQAPNVALFECANEEGFKAYLQVVDSDVELKHLRDFHTHESLRVKPGNYEVRRQREYIPEGYRRAAD